MVGITRSKVIFFALQYFNKAMGNGPLIDDLLVPDGEFPRQTVQLPERSVCLAYKGISTKSCL